MTVSTLLVLLSHKTNKNRKYMFGYSEDDQEWTEIYDLTPDNAQIYQRAAVISNVGGGSEWSIRFMSSTYGWKEEQ